MLKKIQGFSVFTFSLKTMDFDVQHQKLLKHSKTPTIHWKDSGMSRVEVSKVKTADENDGHCSARPKKKTAKLLQISANPKGRRFNSMFRFSGFGDGHT